MVLVPGDLWLERDRHILIALINIHIHLRVFVQISWLIVGFMAEILFIIHVLTIVQVWISLLEVLVLVFLHFIFFLDIQDIYKLLGIDLLIKLNVFIIINLVVGVEVVLRECNLDRFQWCSNLIAFLFLCLFFWRLLHSVLNKLIIVDISWWGLYLICWIIHLKYIFFFKTLRTLKFQRTFF